MADTSVQFNPVDSKVSYTAATGKVQTMCPHCHTCGQYTLTFSDVNECVGHEWPSDLNTSFTLVWFQTVGDIHYFEILQDGWYIYLTCNSANCGHSLHAYSDGAAKTKEAFGSTHGSLFPETIGNMYQTADECRLEVSGYGGTATWSYSSEGC